MTVNQLLTEDVEGGESRVVGVRCTEKRGEERLTHEVSLSLYLILFIFTYDTMQSSTPR